jgi:O-antigen ligase
MPPLLAALLTVAFIRYCYKRDAAEQPNVTSALWLPTLWLMIIGSRLPSQWLNVVGIRLGGQSNEEGNPIDAVIFSIIVFLGLRVLARRRVVLVEFFRFNPWVSAFMFYCLLSVLWSDFSLVAGKRWIKELGHPVMALILLTEPDLEEAFSIMMRRCAFLLIPMSVLLVKYYPSIGKRGSDWGGEDSFVGITNDKNFLGLNSFFFGMYFVWNWLKVWPMERSKARRNELVLSSLYLLMALWLFLRAHSSTAIGAFLVGVAVLLVLGLPMLNREMIGTYAIIVIAIGAVAELTLGVSSWGIALLGRDPTLTGRVYVWRDALALQPNPILGAGFETFWMGARLARMAELHFWRPNEAHNGYIEIYLNLGIIGCILFAGVLLSAFWNCRRTFITDFEFGRFRLAMLAALVVYNWTEAGFKALHPAYFMLYVILVQYPAGHLAPVEQQPRYSFETEDEPLLTRPHETA